jgi:hypothetical protein
MEVANHHLLICIDHDLKALKNCAKPQSWIAKDVEDVHFVVYWKENCKIQERGMENENENGEREWKVCQSVRGYGLPACISRGCDRFARFQRFLSFFFFIFIFHALLLNLAVIIAVHNKSHLLHILGNPTLWFCTVFQCFQIVIDANQQMVICHFQAKIPLSYRLLNPLSRREGPSLCSL